MRSAGLIIHNNRLLVAQNDEFDCFYIVGGGIHEDECSAKAVVRELYEETGYRFEIDRLVFIQERFFKAGNIRHHEVVFFYLMKALF